MMKRKTFVRINKILEKIDDWNWNVTATIIAVMAVPFVGIFKLFQFVMRKLRGKIYDPSLEEWVTKKEQEINIRNEKIKNRELALTSENHVTPPKNGRFYFFEKRNLIIPHDKIVYVETEYNEKLHHFFEDNAKWLEGWQKWYGWDIIECDYEDIKEGMFYPQDFSVFKHGFLWHSPSLSWEKESDIFGEIHYYYDIDPDTDVPIKEQMEIMMKKIYEEIHF